MSTVRTRMRRRVWVGLLAACAGVGGWVVWTQKRAIVPADDAKVKPPFVQLARGDGMDAADRLLQERAELLDPTPLFFPTEWNYGHQPLRVSRLQQPGQFFESFPAIITGEQSIPVYGADVPKLPEKLADVLVQGNEAPFAGLGQIDRPQFSLPVRSGFLEVRRLSESEVIISQPLVFDAPRTDFAPVEFLVVVGPAGLVGEPILTAGSGWEEIDNFFRTYLVKSYRLGERLLPGRYRVVLGT